MLVAQKPSGNVFWSPASLQCALAVLGEGSRGASAEEVASVLRLSTARGADSRFAGLHALNRATAQHLGAPVPTEPAPVPDVPQQVFAYRQAGHLWVQQGFPIKSSFVDTLKASYGPEVLIPADFLTNAEGERLKANAMMAKETEGLVPEALPLGFFNPDTRVAFADVVHTFNAKITSPGAFKAEGEGEVKVAMMSDHRHVRYAAFEADGRLFATPEMVPHTNDDNDPRHYPSAGGYQVIRLGYYGGRASMLFVLPVGDGKLSAFEEALTAPKIDALLRVGRVFDCRLLLPRFKASADWNLVPALQKLGLESVFDHNRADLTGVASPPPPLYVSDFLQKGELEVNERGTIAAVVTAFAIAAGMGMPDLTKPRAFRPRFFADHPFLYLVVDDVTGQVLFMGRVLRP
ncbi:MAG: serpin family protein [Verrucomicrobia bacterium]|nr:serpin family protein [Verrucomicrobiota bacterium]